jgi:hypothetical protein
MTYTENTIYTYNIYTSRNQREGRYAGSYSLYKGPRKHIRDKHGLYEWTSGDGDDVVYNKINVVVSSEYALGVYLCRPNRVFHK